MPWRSGSPHAVFGAGPVLAAGDAMAVVAEVRRTTADITSDTIAIVVAMPPTRSNRVFVFMDKVCARSGLSTGSSYYRSSEETAVHP
jgi:hypothetical protein